MSALPIIASQQRPSVGLFIHQQGTWAGFRPSWDRLVLPYWWVVFMKVIKRSTRGTVCSHIWYLQLSDRAMLRSYHALCNGWTPLSRNPCLKWRCWSRKLKLCFIRALLVYQIRWIRPAWRICLVGSSTNCNERFVGVNPLQTTWMGTGYCKQ